MIMPLEQQVVSLELAKKLKELGMKQESLFYWSHEKETIVPKWEYWPLEEDCSAFTVAELGEMLPADKCMVVKQVENAPKKGYRGCIFRDDACECCGEDFYTILDETLADTEADARAKMLIYLLENNLINL
jgi:hypothetical protein